MPDPTGRISHLPDMHRGVAWKEPVRAATASNIAITGQGAGAAIDGVTLATGDRILLKNQTAASSNGIYQVRGAGLAAIRAFDMDQDAVSSVPASEVVGAVVQVVAGGSNGGTFWRTTNTSAPAIGTDAINWLHMPMAGGAGGAASFGSNAMAVSGRSYVGASTNSAREDHEHLGLVAITSSSSNTLQRPTVNLRAGTNVGFALSDSDGNGAFDTLTITAAATGGGSGAGGALVLLEQYTASSSATLDFTTAISSTYDDYVVEIINLLPATNAVNLLMRVSTDGGSTFATTLYNWTYGYSRIGAVSTGNVTGASDSSVGLGQANSNTGSSGISGRLQVWGPGSSSLYKQGTWILIQPNSGAVQWYQYQGAWYWASASAVNALRFLFSSGNIASGTIRMYGIAK